MAVNAFDPTSLQTTVLLLPAEVELILRDRFILAIKSVKDRTGVDLRHAKESCDPYKAIIVAYRAGLTEKIAAVVDGEQRIAASLNTRNRTLDALQDAERAYNDACNAVQAERDAVTNGRYALGLFLPSIPA